MTTDSGATERAKETASTAADQARGVAGTAREEVQNVAGTAAEQARNVVGDAVSQVSSQLGEQTTTQRDKLAGTLRTFSDDLERMAGQSGGGGMAADLAREVADRARSIGSHLEGREPGQLLDDARDFARRRPGTFLLGALAAGVVAGRLFRATADGAKAASLAEPSTGTTPGTTTGTTPAYAGSTGLGGGLDTGYESTYESTYETGDIGLGSGTGAVSGRPGTGEADDPLSAPPTVSSGESAVVDGPEPVNPPMPPSTPGQRTMDAP